MIGQVQEINGTKQIVPLDGMSVPQLDLATPDNAVLKFDKTNNKVIDSGWKILGTATNSCANPLTSNSATYLDISTTQGNTYGLSNADCPTNQRIIVGRLNTINGCGAKEVFGTSNVADTTSYSLMIGSNNKQCCTNTALSIITGTCNTAYNVGGSNVLYGVSNTDYGWMNTACYAGISGNIIYGVSNTVKNGSNVIIGSSNNSCCFGLDAQGCELYVGNVIIGTSNVTLSGASTVLGLVNQVESRYAHTSTLIGWDNKTSGRYSIGIGTSGRISNPYAIAIGTNNVNCGTYSVSIGNANGVCNGANGGLALGYGAATQYYCGFTFSTIRVGGITSSVSGYCAGNEIGGGKVLVTGCGTLTNLAQAMTAMYASSKSYSGWISINSPNTTYSVHNCVGETGTHTNNTGAAGMYFDNNGNFYLAHNDPANWWITANGPWNFYYLDSTTAGVTKLCDLANAMVCASFSYSF